MKKTIHPFTLIELLVVIGIIAILAAMLMPALGKARATALQAQCINNQKNLAMAIELYSNDWKGTYPWLLDGESGAGVSGGWVYYDAFPVPSAGQFDLKRGTIFPYATTEKVYRCPLDNSRSAASFAINSRLNAAKTTAVSNPAECPLLVEEGTSGAGEKKTTDDAYFAVDSNVLTLRHNKGSVIAFSDIHVEWKKWHNEEIWNHCALVDLNE